MMERDAKKKTTFVSNCDLTKKAEAEIKELLDRRPGFLGEVGPESYQKLLSENARLREALYECPGCGFEFHKKHEDECGGYSCPVCAELELEEENKKLRTALLCEECGAQGKSSTCLKIGLLDINPAPPAGLYGNH